MLSLPLNKNNRIHNNFARTFLEKNQDLLNYVFNPKILKRITTIFNKGYNTKTLENFYNKNISKETILTLEALNNYLNGKSNKEKIDLLQFMRYKLLSEQNTAEATFYIDKKIEKYNGFKYIRPKAYYDISKYQYNEKLNILNECLAKIIQEERSNF